jgi:hypothetical protein
MLEKEIQKKAEAYCDEWGLKWFHIPDGVLGFLAQRANPQVKRLISDNLRGCPDLLIFEKAQRYNYCLALEIKTKTGKLSQGQKNWHKGANVVVAYGWEETKQAIDDFLKFIDEVNDELLP